MLQPPLNNLFTSLYVIIIIILYVYVYAISMQKALLKSSSFSHHLKQKMAHLKVFKMTFAHSFNTLLTEVHPLSILCKLTCDIQVSKVSSCDVHI